MRRRITLCLLVCLIPLVARADTDLAMRALEQGNVLAAYEELRTLAHAGHPLAQYNLGFLYFGDKGIPRDELKAFFWFNRAARAGHAPAQDVLAYMYNHGLGVERDRLRAYVWYSMAAANGIFLAESIKQKLAVEMRSTELIQADLILEDYMRHYPGEGND